MVKVPTVILVNNTTWTHRSGAPFYNYCHSFANVPPLTWATIPPSVYGTITGSGVPLADIFPALFSHSERPHISVRNAWAGGQWNLHLASHLSSTATTDLATLGQALQQVQPNPLIQDRRGMGSKMLPFSSAAFYHWSSIHQPQDLFAPCIWNNVAIPRCKHFLWLVHRHRLPSAALLHHRNIIDSPSCTFCGAHEDQDHLLLRCNRARRI